MCTFKFTIVAFPRLAGNQPAPPRAPGANGAAGRWEAGRPPAPPAPPSKSYNLAELYRISHKLRHRHGPELPLPNGCPSDMPELYVRPNSAEIARPALPYVSQAALAQDRWIYRDPYGVEQGPYGREDVLQWYKDGYFPLDLPMRPASEPSAAFVDLASMLQVR